MDRMVVNAAIERLVSRTGGVNDAQVVIDACKDIPLPKNPLSLEGFIKKKGGGTITGTTEHGDVSVKDDKEEMKEVSFDSGVERVGYYKINHLGRGMLMIRYYWKTDITTSAIDASTPEYLLGYHEDYTPRYFAMVLREPRRLFRIFRLEVLIMKHDIEVFFGDAVGAMPIATIQVRY